MKPIAVLRTLVLTALSLTAFAAPAQTTDPEVLLAQLQALPGVNSAEQAPSNIPDTYFFRLTFVQPIDHADPGGASFLQRVTLLHRDEAAPMVLVTEGYSTSSNSSQAELTSYLEANQLRVEHRFFASSVPTVMDWSKLDIAQSAADLHAVTQAIKTIYGNGWVSTGASKGGMTATYYRYFYPDDVDASVPYVAPSSHGTRDPRYVRFVNQVGPAECRSDLLRFQQSSLLKRDAIYALIPDGDYDALSKDRALEFAILELPFAFWQYFDQTFCAAIPPATASAAELLDFINAIVGVDFFSDPVLDFYAPYFYQSATELGAPRIGEHGLHRLLRYPGEDVPENYPPLGVDKQFDPRAMPMVEHWVRLHGERFLYIYGENDPWSTGAFRVRGNNDSYRFYVLGDAGNHGANLTRLSATDRDFALGKLRQWLGLPARQPGEATTAKPVQFDEPTREELFLK